MSMAVKKPKRRVHFLATSEQFAAWSRAAEREHLTLSSWMRRALSDAAKTRSR